MLGVDKRLIRAADRERAASIEAEFGLVACWSLGKCENRIGR